MSNSVCRFTRTLANLTSLVLTSLLFWANTPSLLWWKIKQAELLSFNHSSASKFHHATLVMSKLKKFYLNLLKKKWSIGSLEPRSFGLNMMSEWMPSKMIFIHLQTFKIRVFNIQIMKNFVVSFWQELFCFDFRLNRWVYGRADDEPMRLLEIFSGKTSGKKCILIGWIDF